MKIQLPFNKADRRPFLGGDMMIYDKDRSFSFHLEKRFNEEVHSRLEKIIIDRGVDGLKGFFHAINIREKVDKTDQTELFKIEINVDKILPRQAW